MSKKSFIAQKRERGQSFMELAISLVFLLVLLSAVIDLGWAFYTMIALRDAAQEAAAFGSMCPDDENLIRERLRLSASTPLDIDDIDPANIEVCIMDPSAGIDCGADIELGNSVRVSVTVQHQILTPFVGMFIGDDWEYPLTVDVANTILRTDCID